MYFLSPLDVPPPPTTYAPLLIILVLAAVAIVLVLFGLRYFRRGKDR